MKDLTDEERAVWFAANDKQQAALKQQMMWPERELHGVIGTIAAYCERVEAARQCGLPDDVAAIPERVAMRLSSEVRRLLLLVMSQWHSVADALPDPGAEVLAFDGSRRWVATYDEFGDGHWIHHESKRWSEIHGEPVGCEVHLRVTHWAELPEPPKTAEPPAACPAESPA
jgi:hypothetical protein